MARTLAVMLVAACMLIPTQVPAGATPDNYTPRPGPTFNSPLGGSSVQRAIFRKVMRSIDSSPRGSQINIFSWNFLTSSGTDALLKAARRGVRVRLLMDERNNTEIDNPPFRRLRAELRDENRQHPKRPRSWARVCQGTCRGNDGSAHTKMFMFSQAGKARRVVMHGSANFTIASTTNQWNDIYAHVGNRNVWRFASRIFREAAADERAKRPYAVGSFDGFRLIMFPNTGKSSPDPVMGVLKRVRCRGATNTASGRTQILIAPDVMRGNRGMRLGQKVRSLWQDGCNVRIGYTVMGIDVGRMLRDQSGRGPVPMKHLVQDFDNDGFFDNYFHLKSMTIVGNYAGDNSGHALVNGSANWAGLATVSDENIGIYRSKRRVLRYQDHLDYWYENFPSGRYARSTATATSSDSPLIFGSGTDAEYENGEPVGQGDFNPFARVQMD